MAVGIVDGHYMLHRVMHVPQLRQLSTKHGKPTGGVFGLIKSLRATAFAFSEIRKLVVVFDGGHSERRKKLFPEYKNRKKNEDVDSDGLTYGQKFGLQLNYLKFLLPALGVKVVLLPGKEGDDVVGLLARAVEDSLKVVVSDDKDMYQLVSDSVHVWRPLQEERISLDNFESVTKCSKDHFLLRKACLGDGSDTIPGIKGVGEGTVDDVLAVCDSVGPWPFEEFFQTAGLIPGKRYERLAQGSAVVLRNLDLMDISLEEFTEDEATYAMDMFSAKSQFDLEVVKRMLIHFECYSLVENFPQWVVPFQMLR